MHTTLRTRLFNSSVKRQHQVTFLFSPYNFYDNEFWEWSHFKNGACSIWKVLFWTRYWSHAWSGHHLQFKIPRNMARLSPGNCQCWKDTWDKIKTLWPSITAERIMSWYSSFYWTLGKYSGSILFQFLTFQFCCIGPLRYPWLPGGRNPIGFYLQVQWWWIGPIVRIRFLAGRRSYRNLLVTYLPEIFYSINCKMNLELECQTTNLVKVFLFLKVNKRIWRCLHRAFSIKWTRVIIKIIVRQLRSAIGVINFDLAIAVVESIE